MDIIPPSLIDTGESDAVPEEKTPVQMANEAHESASVAWVKREVEQHGKHCLALKNLRSLRAWILVVAGFILSASMWGTVTIQASLKADRLELKDEFRNILREEISKVAVADEPAPMLPIAAAPTPLAPALADQPKPRKAMAPRHGDVASSGIRWINPLNYVQAKQ